MSAMTKIHQNTRLSPKSSVRERVPKVAIIEPLTGRRPEQSGLILRSAGDGGITLTSAPVSTKKRRPEYLSVKNSRRLGEWPVTLVAESIWPNRFCLLARRCTFLSIAPDLVMVPAQAVIRIFCGRLTSLLGGGAMLT